MKKSLNLLEGTNVSLLNALNKEISNKGTVAVGSWEAHLRKSPSSKAEI